MKGSGNTSLSKGRTPISARGFAAQLGGGPIGKVLQAFAIMPSQMTANPPSVFDPAKRFETLRNPPIVEAIIDFRATAESSWEEQVVTSRLHAELPDYPQRQVRRAFSFKTEFRGASSTAPAPMASTTTNDGWVGLRMSSQDGKSIAVFSRDGFTYSRLAPYTNWREFSGEALRLWHLHCELAAISEVQRIGARCLNRFDVPVAGLVLSEYLPDLGRYPPGYTRGSFLQRFVLGVPDRPEFAISLLQTMKSPSPPGDQAIGLIIDVDVICTQSLPRKGDIIEKTLNEMHVLRNDVFFASASKRLLDLHR